LYFFVVTERVFGDGTRWNIFTITNEIWGSLGNFPQKKKKFCGKLPSDPQISLVNP
jgi:hypothetical protein